MFGDPRNPNHQPKPPINYYIIWLISLNAKNIQNNNKNGMEWTFFVANYLTERKFKTQTKTTGPRFRFIGWFPPPRVKPRHFQSAATMRRCSSSGNRTAGGCADSRPSRPGTVGAFPASPQPGVKGMPLTTGPFASFFSGSDLTSFTSMLLKELSLSWDMKPLEAVMMSWNLGFGIMVSGVKVARLSTPMLLDYCKQLPF